MIRIATYLALLATATCGAGCASWKELRDTHAPVTQARQERSQAAVQAFEQTRDRAQLDAAIDRWQQGDIAGCESRLRTIIARHPTDVEAHVLLAELAWSFHNAAEAEAEYRAALALAPQRADLLHALGLVLEATNRRDEARALFAQAAQLDPQNDLFRLAASAGTVLPNR